MMDTLAQSFDWVLFDATPMFPWPTRLRCRAFPMACWSWCAKASPVSKVLNKAIESIEKSKLLGVVFNEASMLNVGTTAHVLRRHGVLPKPRRESKKRSGPS